MNTSLPNCIKVKQNYIDNYGVFNSTINLTQINIAIFNGSWDRSESLCFIQSELIKILMSKIHGKSNISLHITSDNNLQRMFSKKPELDMFLHYYTLEEWLLSFCKSTWIYDDHNLVILSALYPQPRSIAKLLNIYSYITWLLIFLFIVLISIIIKINELLQRKEGDFIKMFLSVSGVLVNQGFVKRKVLTNLFSINIWPVLTIVLVSSFSGQILSSILFEPMKTIDSFDELTKSNLTIITGEHSFLDSVVNIIPQFKTGNSEKLNYLMGKLTNISDNEEKNRDFIINQIVERKAVYLREGVPIERLFNKNIHLMAMMNIGRERYLPMVVGYPVNNIPSKARSKIILKIKHSVEAGINNKWMERQLLVDTIEGLRKVKIMKLSFDESNKISQISLEILKDLFFVILFGSIISTLAIIGETMLFRELFCKNNNYQ